MATILKDKKAVVLKLKEPTRVTTVIPTAKLITHKGPHLWPFLTDLMKHGCYASLGSKIYLTH
jgi:hypothetical protein